MQRTVVDGPGDRKGEGRARPCLRVHRADRSPASLPVPTDAMLRRFAESTADLLTVIDAQARILWASPSWRTVLGHDPGRLLGTDSFALVHPEDAPGVRDALGHLRPPGSARALARMRHADGSWRWMDVEGVVTPEGDRPLVTTVARDVTARVEAEVARRASEERLRSLVEHSSNLFYAHTPQHELTYVSPQARQFFDCEPEEALVRWVEFLTDHPVNAAGLEATQRALRTGQRQPKYELQLAGRKGRRIWVEVDEAPVVRDGGVVGIVGALTDITAQKQARQMLQDILDGAPAVIFVKDTEGRYLLVNQLYETLFGVGRDALQGRTDQDFHPPELAATYRANDAEVLRRRAPVTVEEEAEQPGGRRTYLSVKFPLLDELGRPYAVCGIASDITPLKQTELALRDSNDRLREAEEARARLVNMAAHELKTPMTPLKLQIVLLKEWERNLNEQQRAALEVLERNVDRLDQLVDDVLDAVRLQARRLTLDVAPLDLNHVVADALAAFQEAARGSGVALEARLGPSLSVKGDGRRLAQLMFNLLGNAVKFTPSGGRILVETGQEGDQAVVRVRDTGIGLSGKDLQELFQPFSQVEHARGEVGRLGSGLGLFISKGIVEQHGGSVQAESAGRGQGSTFSVRLPLTGEPLVERPPRAPGRLELRRETLADRLRGAL